MDWTIAAVIGAAALNYAFLRNLKMDLSKQVSHLESQYDLMENKIFFLATGRKLEDAILEGKTKKSDG